MCTEPGRGSSGLHNSREACGAGARNSHLECEGSSFVNDSLHVCLVKSGPLTPLPSLCFHNGVQIFANSYLRFHTNVIS